MPRPRSLRESVSGLRRSSQLSDRERAYQDASDSLHAEYLVMGRITNRDPWLNEQCECVWSPLRVKIAKTLLSVYVRALVACVILFNLGLIVYEVDQEAKCYPAFKKSPDACPTMGVRLRFVRLANIALLNVYIAEAALNIFVFRLEYFKDPMNCMDFGICVISSIIFGASLNLNISWLRACRIVKLLRHIEVIYTIPELYMLIAGFFGSMKAMFFGAIMLFCLLAFSSILIVQLIHPVNSDLQSDCPQCNAGFSSLGMCMLTLFQQIVAGDSWGSISVPVVKKSWYGLLLPFVQVVVGVGAMNLILAVVVERAVEARENNLEQVAFQRARERRNHKSSLLSLLKSLDHDRSGTIDRDEIMTAAAQMPLFQHKLHMLGVSLDELGQISDALENPETRDISYIELCNALHDLEAADLRKMIVLLRVDNVAMQRKLLDRLNRQDVLLESITSQGVASTCLTNSQLNVTQHASCANSAVSRGCYRMSNGSGTDQNAVEPSLSVPKDTASSCGIHIGMEIHLIQQKLSLLESCWADALRIAQSAQQLHTEFDKPVPFAAGYSETTSCEPLVCPSRLPKAVEQHVIEATSHGKSFRQTTDYQHVEAFGQRLQHFFRDVEDNAASLVTHCEMLRRSGTPTNLVFL